ncbi:uncharacterized protein BJ171DRAFT_510141 [Polychytrium aggregatum]|uniref:uncharacterized protein n=1 Tax=Polychytrium aggregatum TaxID=110093 RepID=UPI0022FE72C6|nr:uncharacterized protein BJ171DRAFT_510141 [Polychytrium aggregatum]KAI9203263.1 hypothetical protein BJ171DRAFT_510141 [Polychytrium aggregatum]
MASIKLGSLLIRTLAKPIASSIKDAAKQHPRFKEFCMGVAQTLNTIDMKLKMRFFDYKVEAIRPLNDAKAVEVGATFISEAVIFSVAGLTIVAEVYRSNIKSNKSKAELEARLTGLADGNEASQAQIKELKQSIEQLQTELEALKDSLHLPTLPDATSSASPVPAKSSRWLLG